MTDERRINALAEGLASQRQGGGFWRGVGGGISRAFNATPIGHAVHGDWLGAFNSTPIGQLIALARGGNPIGPNNSRAWNNAVAMGPSGSLAGPSGMNAFGPTLGGYGSNASGDAPTWGGTDWNSVIGSGPATPGGMPTLPGTTVTAVAPTYAGAAQNMGRVGQGLGGNAAGGLGRLMMGVTPWKQSGDTYFGARQGAF